MKSLGIEVVIISKEKNKVVTARAKKLDLVVYQGVDNKVEAIDRHLQRTCLLSPQPSFWYVGNDRNDIDALLKSDLAICPRDAIPEVRRICDVILRTRGGYGIFSELLREIENAC
jgi:N-acylneuraminate cytidylyltransferase